MLDNTLVKSTLDNFFKTVVKESKTSLTKKKKNASKTLYNSINYDLKVSDNSFEGSFEMEDYGTLVDQGVKGKGGKKADGTKWKLKKTFGTKFKYKSKKPPISAFNGWTIRRGIAPRNKSGQFTSRKSLLFAISNSVYHTGLETTHFFTKPFEAAFKRLPDELVKAYGLEVDKFLKITLE
tara:strand:- start:24537 stop:25076 length:540 start_codon:yes stop_codon:yes gene_type:complete